MSMLFYTLFAGTVCKLFFFLKSTERYCMHIHVNETARVTFKKYICSLYLLSVLAEWLRVARTRFILYYLFYLFYVQLYTINQNVESQQPVHREQPPRSRLDSRSTMNIWIR